MKIAIVSDTHKSTSAIMKVAEIIKEENPDIVLHLGDLTSDADFLEALIEKEVRRVPGNCDYSRGEPDSLLIEVDEHKLFATHGHFHGVKMNLAPLLREAKEKGATIALYGHTHIAHEETIGKVTLFNPGSPALPKGGQKKSMAFLEISGNSKSF
ncbi:MAG: metallophosphoesterase [Clostridium sp.]|nr:metallophosphoesterase [Clostridium sp.]